MARRIPVLYGTETGNAEYCAEMLVSALEAEGHNATHIDMDDYPPEDIHDEAVVFIVTSTYGNGDPPANAFNMMEYLKDDSVRLEGLRFAVCGLGDTSFQHFAQCGKDFDRLLQERGAKRLVERVDCDEDFEVPFDQFKTNLMTFVRANPTALSADGASNTEVPEPLAAPTAPISGGKYTKDAPFSARIRSRRLLSGQGSAKETMHYELDIAGASFSFEVGDSFGVCPTNDPSEVQEVLEALQLTGSELVTWQGGTKTLKMALQTTCLQTISVDLVKRLSEVPKGDGESLKGLLTGLFAKRSKPDIPAVTPASQALAGGDHALKAYIKQRHVLDALKEHPAHGLKAAEVVSLLRKLQPRLYSVASSPTATPDHVAFTVETLRYSWNNRAVKGVATCWLADRVDEQTDAPLYLVQNDGYRFPYDDETPVIMVGPGTGVAPFRAYLAELEARGGKNDTWLFFGHQHAAFDYLYGEEFEAWHDRGVLNELSLAWSRDQPEKVYVQHLVAEQGAKVWAWIERGAKVYICGDANGMAPGVAEALKTVAVEHGAVDDPDAWLHKMTEAGRYLTDVY